MKNNYFTIILILSLMLIFSTGCASSSYSKRYGTHSVNTEIKNTNIPRFTSEDNIIELETYQVTGDDLTIFEDDEDFNDIDLFINESKNFTAKELKERFKLTDESRLTFSKKNLMLYEMVDYLGTPYRYGKTGDKGIDCSGFTRNVLEKLNIQLPRSAREQYKIGDNIERNELIFGDLVFFNTRRASFPGHVGIYIGDELFVHASTKKGVIVSSMEEKYYKTRYVGARRITTFEKENQLLGDKNDI